MIKQKEACYQVITAMVEVDPNTPTVMSKDQIHEAALELTAMTERGEVEVKNSQEDLPKYWRGTVRNWLRRDLRLNGNVPDTPKFKRGSKESKEIKATRAFIASLEQDPEANAERIVKAKDVLQQLIDKAAAERARKEINIDDLPEELRELAS